MSGIFDTTRQLLKNLKTGVSNYVSGTLDNFSPRSQNQYVDAVLNKAANLPRFELPQTILPTNTNNQFLNMGRSVVRGFVESPVNIPRNLITGYARLEKEQLDALRQKRLPNLQNVAAGAANLGEAALDLFAPGIGKSVAVNASRNALAQGAKFAIKKGIVQGAIPGAVGGLTYGVGNQYQKPFDFGEVVTNTLAGGTIGGVLGGATSTLGSLYKMTNRPPELTMHLRDLAGRFKAGDNPVKPKGMSWAQWNFQLSANKELGRNPYEPVFPSDLQKLIKNKGGMSVKKLTKFEHDQNVAKLGDTVPNTPVEAKVGDSLVEEAKKYKSAEDFVNSRIKMFHQTSTAAEKSIQKEGFKLGLNGSGRSDTLPSGVNTKRTTNPLNIQGSGSQIELGINPNIKIKDFENRNEAERFFYNHTNGKKYREYRDNVNLIDHNAAKEADRLMAIPVKNRQEAKKYLDMASKVLNKADKEILNHAKLAREESTKISNKEGIEALRIGQDFGGWTGRSVTDNLIVLDPTKVKTRSQLIDIWNQSNKNPQLEDFLSGKIPDTVSNKPINAKIEDAQAGMYDLNQYSPDVISKTKDARVNLAKELTSERAKIYDKYGFDNKRIKQLDETYQKKAKELLDNTPQSLPPLKRSEMTGMQLSRPTSPDLENVSPQDRANLVAKKHKELKSELETAIRKQKVGSQLGQASGVSISDMPQAQKEIMDSARNLGPKEKVNLLDYVRTPDRVLTKIGLGKEAILLKKQYRNYVKELPTEINRITGWYKKASNPESAVSIFRYLDGKLTDLTPQELEVAKEIQTYLKEWAVKLKLPADKQVTHYITHLFDEDFIKKDFDPDIARLITDQVPGSVYDPFLQKRLGALGYKENVWEALDAYTKRAVRKYNMDPALESLKKASSKLDVDSEKYVARLGARINLRPTEMDNLLDNLVKSVAGYKLGARPVANVTRKVRQAVYRGTLGLNVGSAMRNLTQGANTYAKLGEKYTIKGYIEMFKDLLQNGQELKSSGILSQDIIQDRTINATKKFTENVDKGLFSLFSFAERVNRGSAYFGAKAKALAQGLSEEEAIQKAIKTVEDTQFTFGSVDTPLALQSDLAKIFTQFQSYNVKQTEFLGEMIKNKEFAGLVRFTGANLVFMATIGKLFGMELKDLVPFSGILSGETKIGQTPAVQALGAVGNIAFGDEEKKKQGIYDLKKVLPAFVPAGVQAKKTVEGIQAFNQGASTTATGRTRFQVPQTPENRFKTAVFGQYSIPEAKEYFKNMGKSKSELIYNEINKGKTKEEKVQIYQKLVKEGKITKDNLSDIKSYFNDQKLKLTTNEKSIRSLPVKDGSRARMIKKQLDRAITKEEKQALWKRYVESKIITDEVSKQVKDLFSK